MKIAYFDCFSGISGNMILGALIDAGLDLKELELELRKLRISGFELHAERTERQGISGTKFKVEISERQVERHLKDITQLIDQSDLSDAVKELSNKIFKQLASIEAKIHNKGVEEIHFHEVGGLDSIIDVIGSVVGIKKLGIDAVWSSKIHVGTGFVECQHGVLPVPAPATLELLKGIPIYSRAIATELVTPTGACILKNLSRSFGVMPEMKVEKIGYGAGTKDLKIPNLLRVYVGETSDGEYDKDEVILVETNIDDMNPELFDYACEMLLNQGALDVFMTSILMKKNRPATMLSVLAPPDRMDRILSTIFAETTTLGVRIHRVERKKLVRETISVRTRFGEIKVKVSRVGEQIQNVAPEYEECKEMAIRQNVPLREVYDEVRWTAQKALSERKKPHGLFSPGS
jgi:uncharacterized protein (TIGR00299 family) protein